MRDATRRWHEAQQHDAWFRGEVEQALEEVADHSVERVAHDRVLSTWQGRVAGTRELVVVGTPYIVVYRIEPAAVVILRVLHGAQRWPSD